MKVVHGNTLKFIPASHEDAENPGVLKKVLACKEDLIRGQIQMVNWSHLPAGSEFQLHYHEDMQEVFVMLNGQVEMSIGGKVFELAGGDAVIVDPGEVHQMKNICGQDVQYVVFGVSTETGGQTVVVSDEERSS